jgi:hypothetical protein
LPFSLTGSADDVGAFVAALVSGALPDDVAGVSFVDAVVFDDASEIGAVGGSAAHAAVPHARVAKTAKTTRSAACVRFRSRSRGPSIRPLVPSTPHAGRLRSRARSTCLLHLHFLESMGTPSFSTRACAAPSLCSGAQVEPQPANLSTICPQESRPFTTLLPLRNKTPAIAV